MAMRMKARFLELGGFCGKGWRQNRFFWIQRRVRNFRKTGRLQKSGRHPVHEWRRRIRRLCDTGSDTSVTFGKLLPESYMGELMRSMYTDREAYPVYSTFQTAFALEGEQDPIGKRCDTGL